MLPSQFNSGRIAKLGIRFDRLPTHTTNSVLWYISTKGPLIQVIKMKVADIAADG